MKFDTHCHSIYSKHWFWGVDALNTPREIVKTAVKKGLDGIAITDHQTVKGGLIGKKVARTIDKDFIVIPGIEIRTKSGDIVGLDVKENIPDKLSVEEVVEKIHDLGGIAVAVHPFAEFIFRRCVGEESLKADAIEVFNAGSSRRGTDKKARKLAERFKKPITAGSDAHWHKSIGNAGVICDSDLIDDILKRKVKIFGRYTSYIHLSYMICRKFARSIKWGILKTKPKYI